MIYTIRDNEGNIVCSVENTTTIEPTVSYESINAELKDLNEYGNKLDKSIEAFNLVSDTRAMEALGYVKGAGFSNNVKAVGNAIWEKIKGMFVRIRDIFVNLGKWIVEQFNKIKNHFNEKKMQSGTKLLTDACNGSKTVEEVTDKIVVESVKMIPDNTVNGKIVRLAIENKSVDRSILMLEDNREETAKYNNNKEYEQAALAKYEELRKKEEERIKREKEALNNNLNKLLASPAFIEWMNHHSERESLNTGHGKVRNFAETEDFDEARLAVQLLKGYIETAETNSFDKNKTLIEAISKLSNRLKETIDVYNSTKNKSTMTTDKLIFNLKLILNNDFYSVSNFKNVSASADYAIKKATGYIDDCIKMMNKLINDKETNISKEVILSLISPIHQYLRIYVSTVTAEVHSLSMAMPVIASIADIPKKFYNVAAA